MRAEYREEPCRNALNRVRGMPFALSLNPYMGCAHRCTFCYVRAFEARADRPWDDRYGASIRVKTNVAEVLRRELARPSWQREPVAIGAATDPYQPAEGRYRLTRACIEAFAEAASPFSIITRGPLIVRDVDVLAEAARRADVSVTFSVPTLDEEIWRRTEPGTAPPRQRLRALARLVEAGIDARVGMAPILPGLSDRPELLAEVVREARAAGATGIWANLLYLRPGNARALPRRARARLARAAAEIRAAVPPRRLSPAPRDRSGAGPRARARAQPRRPRPASGAARARRPGRTAADSGYVTADSRSMISRPWPPRRSPA